MRPDTSGALGSVSTDTALGYASSAAQCVAKVLRERPDATAVKYGTKTGAHRIESGVCSSVIIAGRSPMAPMTRAECAEYAATLGQTPTVYNGGPYGCWKHEQSGSPNNGRVYWREPGSGDCLLYTSPSPRDGLLSRMPSSA